MKTTAWLGTIVLALTLASVAHGTALDDATAGLDAYNRGAYDDAIRLFTKAIQSGRLSSSDKEFAYLNRGNAYAGKGDYPRATADLKLALKLKPDDTDAQQALQAVVDKQSEGADEQAQASAAPVGGGAAAWGPLAAMADHYYWYQSAGQPDHSAYVKVSWATPQEALSLSIKTKDDQPEIYEYKLDDKTGKIIVAGVVSSASVYGTLKVTARDVTLYAYADGTPSRSVIRPRPDGSYVRQNQTYSDGHWRDGASAAFLPTTADELTAAGLLKAKKH